MRFENLFTENMLLTPERAEKIAKALEEQHQATDIQMEFVETDGPYLVYEIDFQIEKDSYHQTHAGTDWGLLAKLDSLYLNFVKETPDGKEEEVSLFLDWRKKKERKKIKRN